jgi:hypothetical protein
MSEICRGCGVISNLPVCQTCLVQENTWQYRCNTCSLSSPLPYCVPCHISFKQEKANQRCERCAQPSSLKYCAPCFRSLRKQGTIVCSGCGSYRAHEEACCRTCALYDWHPCMMCTQPTPFPTLCYRCAKIHCISCFQPVYGSGCLRCAQLPCIVIGARSSVGHNKPYFDI